MRITGGHSRGRLLSPLKGLGIRPTSDRVKEAFFNILGQDITGFKVLDLFAGTGALGIEAISRGAESALFIDKSRQSINLIKKNLEVCGFEDKASVLQWDLMKGLNLNHPMKNGLFDLVFVDPPYGKDLIPPTLKFLSEEKILAGSFTIVVESSRDDELPSEIGTMELFDTRRYGTTKIDFYHNRKRK